MLFTDRVVKAIEKYGMLQRGETVLVGLSGGPDSVALLYALLELNQQLDIRIAAFHLDHRLRAESADDAAFVVSLCKSLRVKLESESFDVPAYINKEGLSVEDGARQVRYRLLYKAADRLGAQKIALGHHADDQVETFLMRIIRGSGLTGLSSIPPVRDRIIRPFIQVRRGEILAYLAEKRAEFVVDASNEDTSYLRNRVRAQLIPELLEYNPSFVEVAAQNVLAIQDDETFLKGIEQKEFEKIALTDGEGSVALDIDALVSMAPALARRIVRRAIEAVKGNLHGIEFRHIISILEGAKAGFLRQNLPGGVVAALEGGDLVLYRGDAFAPVRLEGVEIPIPGELSLPDLGVVIKTDILDADKHRLLRDANIAQLDFDLLAQPLFARTWRAGDFFCPLGMKGRKKVQDFLVDEKVPRRRRSKMLIVQAGEDIAWLVGLRIDDRFKVTPKTRRIMLLSVRPIGSM